MCTPHVWDWVPVRTLLPNWLNNNIVWCVQHIGHASPWQMVIIQVHWFRIATILWINNYNFSLLTDIVEIIATAGTLLAEEFGVVFENLLHFATLWSVSSRLAWPPCLSWFLSVLIHMISLILYESSCLDIINYGIWAMNNEHEHKTHGNAVRVRSGNNLFIIYYRQGTSDGFKYDFFFRAQSSGYRMVAEVSLMNKSKCGWVEVSRAVFMHQLMTYMIRTNTRAALGCDKFKKDYPLWAIKWCRIWAHGDFRLEILKCRTC